MRQTEDTFNIYIYGFTHTNKLRKVVYYLRQIFG